VLWLAAGFLWDHHFRVFGQLRYLLAAFDLFLGSCIIGGIYLTTRPAFRTDRSTPR